MKKSDIATIALIAGFSVIISYFVVSSLPFFSEESTAVKVPTATPITSEVAEIDKDVFNANAVNPTVEINIATPDNKPVDVNSTEGQ